MIETSMLVLVVGVLASTSSLLLSVIRLLPEVSVDVLVAQCLMAASLCAIGALGGRSRTRVPTDDTDSPDDSPPDSPADRPSPVPFLVARQSELDALRDILVQPGAVPCAMGPGGAGKTYQVRALAQELGAESDLAQIEIDLKGSGYAKTAQDALRELVQALAPEAHVEDDIESLTRQYHYLLESRPAVLLLNDAYSPEQVEPLLPVSGGSVALLTSRRPCMDGPIVSVRLGPLPDSAAIRLLLDTAPRLNEADARLLATLCGGMPMALSLVGHALNARPDLSVRRYMRVYRANRLNEDKVADALAASVALLPRTLDGSRLAWLRQSPERTMADLWAELAVFGGSFDFRAASVVWGVQEDAARASLRLFLRFGLVRRNAVSGRYDVHRVAQAYGKARLGRGEWRRAAGRFSAHYCEVMLRIGQEMALSIPLRRKAAAHLWRTEQENIINGQAWAARFADQAGPMARLAVEYARVEQTPLWQRLSPEKRLVWLDAAHRGLGHVPKAVQTGTRWAELGRAYANAGQAGQAIICFDSALAADEGSASRAVAADRWTLDKAQRALAYFDQTLTVSRCRNDQADEGGSLVRLGRALIDLGRPDGAVAYCEPAVAIAQEVGDELMEAMALSALGLAYAELGQYQVAVVRQRRALSLARGSGQKHAEGVVLYRLGCALAQRGDSVNAFERHCEALELVRDLGDKRIERDVLMSLSRIAYADADDASAERYNKQALDVCRELGDQRGQALVLAALGAIAFRGGAAARATVRYEDALDLLNAMGDRGGIGLLRHDLALAYADAGDDEMAVESMEQALRELEQAASPHVSAAREWLDTHGDGPQPAQVASIA